MGSLRRGMEPRDIGALVTPSDPRVSPNGTTVAVTVTTVDLDANAYRSRIWLVAADGSAPARPFTRGGDARDSRPRWSPDGSRLAFVSHRRDTGSEVLVLPVTAGGEAVVAAVWSEEVEELEWSPDGTRLAFLARAADPETYGPGVADDRDRPPRRVTRFTHRRDDVGWTMDRPARVHVVAADGSGGPVEVAGPGAAGADAAGLAWSRDGSRLAWCQPVADDWDVAMTRPLIVAPVPGGEGEPSVLAPGAHADHPSFGPGDSTLAVILDDEADPPRNAQVALVSDAGPTVLTAGLDRHCAPHGAGVRGPVWEGEHVWFMADDRGAVHLYRVAVTGPAIPERMVEGALAVTGFDVAGSTVAFTAASATSTGEVFVLDRSEDVGSFRRVTGLGDPFSRQVTMTEPEHISVRSAGAEVVDAWFLPPTAAPRGATLLSIHGGPFTQYTTAFFDEFAIWSGAGYGVVWCNPRGSSGRAESWGRAIRGPRCERDPGSGWGGLDAEDVLAVVDAAIERFGLDPGRIGVLGGSYGGFLTAWLVGHGERFAAACAERGVYDQLSMVWTSDIGTSFQRGHVGVDHLEDPGEYLRLSPVTYARAVTTPLLIVHSDGDLRCPVSQAEEMWTALRMLGRDVELVRFPGAGHELSRSGPPRQRVRRAEVILDFFDRHL